jgi:predicted acyltransferase
VYALKFCMWFLSIFSFECVSSVYVLLVFGWGTWLLLFRSLLVEGADGKHCLAPLLILSAEFVLHLVSSAIISVDLKPPYLPESSPMTPTCRI